MAYEETNISDDLDTDVEELDISDDDADAGDDDAGEAVDRGDVVAVPGEEKPDGDDDADASDDDADNDADADSDADADPDPDVESNQIPFSRFAEVNKRMKVAEAENDKLRAQLDESADAGTGDPAPVVDVEADASKVISEKMDKFYEMNEEGDFEEARILMGEIQILQTEQSTRLTKQIVAEALQAQKAQDADAVSFEDASEVAVAVKDMHPELDPKSDDFNQATFARFNALADTFVNTEGIPLSEALKEARQTLYGDIPDDKAGDEPDPDAEDAVERKRKSLMKNADASKRQPPRLDKGTGQRETGEKKTMKDMAEEEFDSLPDSAKDRGDKV